MSETPIQLIFSAFQDEKSSAEALKVMKQAWREKMIGVQNAAVLRKDEKSEEYFAAVGLIEEESTDQEDAEGEEPQ